MKYPKLFGNTALPKYYGNYFTFAYDKINKVRFVTNL